MYPAYICIFLHESADDNTTEKMKDILSMKLNYIWLWRSHSEALWTTPSLSLLPGSFWFGVVAPVKVPSMDQIEPF